MSKRSKFLSLILRHKPEEIGLSLDKNGWANVKLLLSKAKMSMTELEEIVETNNKKRFEFNENKTKIRARQGHSIKIDLGYEEKEPPEFLYHGTATRFIEPIYKDGLSKMNRHAVHLSKDFETAINVGQRHGKPIVLLIYAQKMHKDGHKFYLTGNDVWYTDHVPTKYLAIIS